MIQGWAGYGFTEGHAASFALTGYRVEHQSVVQGAFSFVVVNSVGAFFLLTGIALLYGRTGALNLAQIGQVLARDRPDGLVVVAFTFIVVGFLTKAGAVPSTSGSRMAMPSRRPRSASCSPA